MTNLFSTLYNFLQYFQISRSWEGQYWKEFACQKNIFSKSFLVYCQLCCAVKLLAILCLRQFSDEDKAKESDTPEIYITDKECKYLAGYCYVMAKWSFHQWLMLIHPYLKLQSRMITVHCTMFSSCEKWWWIMET